MSEPILFISLLMGDLFFGFMLACAIRKKDGPVLGCFISTLLLIATVIYLAVNPRGGTQVSGGMILAFVIMAAIVVVVGLVIMIAQNTKRRRVLPLLEQQAIKSGAVITRAMNPNGDPRRP